MGQPVFVTGKENFMKKYKMNWKNLLSVNSQRPRSNKRGNRQEEPEEAFNRSKEKPYSDLRSDFERDYHRILSSASFRRLQDKTQVFPLEKNDFIKILNKMKFPRNWEEILDIGEKFQRMKEFYKNQ